MRPALAALLALALPLVPVAARALSCGDDASGFEAWKQEFAPYAAQNGVGAAGLAALAGANYDSRTISKDRNQTGVRYALDDFLAIRWSDAYTSTARRMLQSEAAFFDSIEAAYGVPGGVLLAIYGMESGFGANMGDHNTVSSILTVAYDCRRADFFVPHAVAALLLVDQGSLSPGSIGAAHGESGLTQMLPGNILAYRQDGDGDGRVDLTGVADAMASTANFLRQKGWQPGAGYQEGEPNFAAIEQWNAATVYERAIAILGQRIES